MLSHVYDYLVYYVPTRRFVHLRRKEISKIFMNVFKLVFLLSATVVFMMAACEKKSEEDLTPSQTPPSIPDGATEIPPYVQNTAGDANRGWDYLRYENYIGAGLPFSIFQLAGGFSDGENENLLQREGDNAEVSRFFNVYELETGTKMVTGITCFACHTSKLDGEFIPGLGNSFTDFPDIPIEAFAFLDGIVINQYGKDSPEWEEYQRFKRGASVTFPYLETPFKGVNPAFMFEEASNAYRNPVDLTWQDTLVYPLEQESIASDVPPLWNVKKKHALYYTGLGRGDFTKHLMQVASVMLKDSAQAAKIHANFDDVLAWIWALEPPQYPKNIDQPLANNGKKVFVNTCQRCHGTYGAEESYPNLVLDVNTVKTDPVYAQRLNSPGLKEWFNNSWYTQEPAPAASAPSEGYVAPPLDGIWATAPYLHNGSVPTLEALLNSNLRPTFWRRSFDDTDFNYETVGWNYTREDGPTDEYTYNTTIPGYGNQGHTYGDPLSDEERKALLEYLKTL